MSKVLPNTLSGLLRLGVKDAKKCQKDPKYKLDMMKWHLPTKDVCYVCLAGSIMAQTLKLPCSTRIYDLSDCWIQIPSELSDDNSYDNLDKLKVLDDMRNGSLDADFDRPFYFRLFDLSGCQINFEKANDTFNSMINKGWKRKKCRASWKTYLKAADYLESVGL